MFVASNGGSGGVAVGVGGELVEVAQCIPWCMIPPCDADSVVVDDGDAPFRGTNTLIPGTHLFLIFIFAVSLSLLSSLPLCLSCSRFGDVWSRHALEASIFFLPEPQGGVSLDQSYLSSTAFSHSSLDALGRSIHQKKQ